jgi:NAD-dependent SIR2 family protein deacetylase
VFPGAPTHIAQMTGTAALQEFIERHRSILVLTGAGCSTNSGIPDYRDVDGAWKHAQPMTFQAFMGSESARRRYWARSLVGWRRIGAAQPNAAHAALAKLEALGRSELLLTQNVDGLHQRVGHHQVVDLHGRLDEVRCMGCGLTILRDEMQMLLVHLNPAWAGLAGMHGPDGDADLDTEDFSAFVVPGCPDCRRVLKPDVVFFGENVPRRRVDEALAVLARADAMLVVGSSLMVYSGFRFVQAAADAGKPVAAVNLGRTRADGLLALKVEADCAAALSFLLEAPPAEAEGTTPQARKGGQG